MQLTFIRNSRPETPPSDCVTRFTRATNRIIYFSVEAVLAQNNTTNQTDETTTEGSGSFDESTASTTTVPPTTTSDAVSATPAFVMFASFLFVSIARNLL